MSTGKPKPGRRGGAPFKTPGKNTKAPLANQTILALRGEGAVRPTLTGLW